ncbi:SMI1/KNR4 family protein [Streptomyces sp. NPDC002276]
MDVEIPALVRDAAARFGAGAPYALKAVAGQLADDPDMGVPSQLPGIRTVLVDGELFEDCPALAVGYLHEPDRIEIRYVTLAPSAESDDVQVAEQERELAATPGDPTNPADPTDPDVTALTVREVADAWRRITHWLRDNAPDSYAALRTGAELAAVAALESELGVRIPVELTVLWLLTGGDDGSDGRGCLPGNRALLPLDAVAAVYRRKTDAQASMDTADAGRPEEERITVWRPGWIPVVADGPNDRVAGLYLDTETGFLGRWSRYHDIPDDERDTLVTYLEETADALEAPALSPRDEPGLIGGTLVWRSSIDPAREGRWRPLKEPTALRSE